MADYKTINHIKDSSLQMETSKELEATFSDYHGDSTARQCGSLGGEMMKKRKKHTKNET